MPLPPAPVSFGPFDGGDDVDCRGDHGKSLAIATGIRNLGNDDRLQSPDVTVTANAQQASLTIKIVSELAPGAPFAFVFRATSLTVAFLDARPV
jgi:hypothetical protein